MIPVLIMMIFIFPFVATVIMGTWTESITTMELKTTAGHMSSSIQQLCYTINSGSYNNGTMKINLAVPTLIQGHTYTTTLSHLTQSDSSFQLMNVTLKIVGGEAQASSLITLGSNINWQENLAFNSTAPLLYLGANKTANSVLLCFGGS
jgi:hypothetical protein